MKGGKERWRDGQRNLWRDEWRGEWREEEEGVVEKMERGMDGERERERERGMAGDGWRDGCSRKQELLGRWASAACPFFCLVMKRSATSMPAAPAWTPVVLHS